MRVAKEKAFRFPGREEGRVLGREGPIQQETEVPQGRTRQRLWPKERHWEPNQGPGNTGKELHWGGWDGKAANRLWWMKEGTAAEGQMGRGAGGESKAVTKGKEPELMPVAEKKDRDTKTSEHSHFKSNFCSFFV